MAKCPQCNSSRFVVRAGFRKNKFGKKQKYRCNDCWFWFVNKDAFWHRAYPKKIIAEACSCYKRGMSFNDVAEHLNEYKGTSIVPSTIFYWVTHYSTILKKNQREIHSKFRK